MSFTGLWDTLLPIGLDHSTGGYRRFAWTAEDEQCRAWFTHSAAERNLRTHCDRNGNLWAWWDSPRQRLADGAAAVVTGSHLDSVPDGARSTDRLGSCRRSPPLTCSGSGASRPPGPSRWRCSGRRRAPGSALPAWAAGCLPGRSPRTRPAPCATSTGSASPRRWRQPGTTRDGIGHDEDLLASIGAYVELHIEQGRALADSGRGGRDRRGHLAARPVAARLHRAG